MRVRGKGYKSSAIIKVREREIKVERRVFIIQVINSICKLLKAGLAISFTFLL
jgi:hypothetical protein